MECFLAGAQWHRLVTRGSHAPRAECVWGSGCTSEVTQPRVHSGVSVRFQAHHPSQPKSPILNGADPGGAWSETEWRASAARRWNDYAGRANCKCVVQPCELYLNEKPANQYLFAAAAALYALTGDPYYRGDADSLWPAPEEFPELQTYLYNWNNVITQVRLHPPPPRLSVGAGDLLQSPRRACRAWSSFQSRRNCRRRRGRETTTGSISARAPRTGRHAATRAPRSSETTSSASTRPSLLPPAPHRGGPSARAPNSSDTLDLISLRSVPGFPIGRLSAPPHRAMFIPAAATTAPAIGARVGRQRRRPCPALPRHT